MMVSRRLLCRSVGFAYSASMAARACTIPAQRKRLAAPNGPCPEPCARARNALGATVCHVSAVLFPWPSICSHWRRLSLSLAWSIRGGKTAAILNGL